MAQEPPKTVDELMDRIVKMSGEDPSKIPVAKGFAWFGIYDEEKKKLGPPTALRLGGRSPFNPNMGIVAMFQNDVEARVYAVLLRKPEGEDVPFTRHTLSKTAPTFFWEALHPEVFQAEIADELRILKGETAEPEDFELEQDEDEEPEEEATQEASEETAAPAT